MTIYENDLQNLLNVIFRTGATVAANNIKNKINDELDNYDPIDMMPGIVRVLHQEPATVIFWDDGTKTVVKTQNGEKYDPEKGFAMAFIKRVFNNGGSYYEMFKAFCPKDEDEENNE